MRTLRFEAALGPLQELGARGVLSFSVSASQTGSRIRMSYRVAGDAGLGLEALAPIVDAVMMEQFGRLSRLCTTGSPN